ncbi:alpha-hydroxy-acid oxidizing protein [Alkalicoccobacillus porphyridii]|uniref:L-lactate oxidase n=1 Tax=Alkalicoccobacillus porphyridii TaxID=2597270 RepID=A0A554A1Q1_9BACI|nr:alpha-hydroxy-acid oxidizing protein [Alkalicoccobacillus porphyridii]TSB47599.1 alpha-hydroxy-acid oxidizing protein [Alkalicoccobacillus porphyridii]
MSAKSFTTIGHETKDHPIYIEEWEQLAKEKLKKGPFDYVRSGAGDEKTLAANRAAFDKWSIYPRVLRDVTDATTRTKLLNQEISLPLLLAPLGYQGIIHPDAECASARAAEKAGIPFVTSTVSTRSLEEVAEAAPTGKNWFQLYWSNNREVSASMVSRAEAAGYQAIVVTVDTGLLGWRKSDFKNGFAPLKEAMGDANYRNDPAFRKSVPHWTEENIREEILKNILHPNLVWEDLLFLREHTLLPILVKGILHPDDAEKAVDLGLDGIIVSNHGGRQLDGALASIDALPAIAARVNKRVPLLVDSGFRSGSDLYKALALGADAVLIGRPYIYGLAVSGEAGVTSIIKNLQTELDLTLALSGANSINELSTTNLIQTGC